ncbi:MAG TPA: SlyX family protein [Planctomycetota bacterium]|nr:SlyX family protein [Planctomycetota bacterium]
MPDDPSSLGPSFSPGSKGSLIARISELEMRITFQEDQLDSLHKALYLQSRLLDDMKGKFELWMEAMRAGSGQGELPSDETPPHY